jgi:hypothetical protein
MTVRRRRGISRRVGAIFVDVWRLFKARFIDPRGPDVSRLATFASASADAAHDALGREIPRYVHNARDESHALEDREADGTRASCGPPASRA